MERNDLVKTLQALAHQHRGWMQDGKAWGETWGAHRDWPWNGVVLSGATRGGAARWKNNVEPRYETELSWPVISQLPPDEVRRCLETVGRFWRRTADWLDNVYRHIKNAGGPAEIRKKLSMMKEPTEVIKFWKTFPGIGDKYARNIMMDVYDTRFRTGYFAIDSRLGDLIPLLGYTGRNLYEEKEAFLNALACEVGINSRELDRLLFQAHNEINEALM